jgi:hypothetical protein
LDIAPDPNSTNAAPAPSASPIAGAAASSMPLSDVLDNTQAGANHFEQLGAGVVVEPLRRQVFW